MTWLDGIYAWLTGTVVLPATVVGFVTGFINWILSLFGLAVR